MTNKLGVDVKQCSRCEIYKPYSEYYKNNKTKDKYCSRCIHCTKESVRTWKKNNPEKVNAQNRRWSHKNPEKVLQFTRNYRIKNPDSVSNNNHKRRDLKINNGTFVVTKSFIKKLYSSDCVYCGSKEKIQADHVIPLTKGGRHSEGNLVPACQKCNLDKRGRTITEWKKAKRNPA